VHHAPSHDSRASFEEVIEAAFEAELDFVVITDHAPLGQRGALPASERSGIHRSPDGREVLVLVGAEIGTRDGHLLALDVPELPRSGYDVSGAAAVASIHELGGFAVVPHPFSHGGWHGWDAPFDGIEVHNNASAFHGLGLLLPPALISALVFPRASLRFMLDRPDRELDRFEQLVLERRVVAFSGADAHQNISLLGWPLDPYARMFRAVQTVCPEMPLEPSNLWRALKEGECFIRYSIHDADREDSLLVEFPSGRRERWSRRGRRVLEVYQAPALHGLAERSPRTEDPR